MTKLCLLFAVCAFVIISPTVTLASLIGDTVVIEHHFPDLGTVYSSESVLVEAGSDDIVLGAGVYSVNVEENSILVGLTGALPDITLFDANFNGLVVRDLDWIGSPGKVVKGATISTNFVGWDDSRFTFTDDSVLFNWESLTITTSTFFNVTIESGISAVPVPPPLWLFISGLLGLLGITRNKSNL